MKLNNIKEYFLEQNMLIYLMIFFKKQNNVKNINFNISLILKDSLKISDNDVQEKMGIFSFNLVIACPKISLKK